MDKLIQKLRNPSNAVREIGWQLAAILMGMTFAQLVGRLIDSPLIMPAMAAGSLIYMTLKSVDEGRTILLHIDTQTFSYVSGILLGATVQPANLSWAGIFFIIGLMILAWLKSLGDENISDTEGASTDSMDHDIEEVEVFPRTVVTSDPQEDVA